MKKIFGAIAFVLFFAIASVNAQGSKIGHVSMQELIQALPDYKIAEGNLQSFAKQLQDTYTSMQDEYNQKLSAYMKDSANMTPPMKEAKMQDIADLAKRMQKMEQTSDQTLMDKQNELLKPMQSKVSDAIKSVAKDNGYSYIFDTSNGTTLVYYPETENLTPLVKKKLGL